MRGSFTRAYVNGAEWKLAIGLKPKQIGNYDPGKIYGPSADQFGSQLDDIETILGALDGYDNSLDDKNTYPIKTEITMDVNSVDNISMNDGTQNLAGHKIVADIKGVMIDAAAIVMGGPSDITLWTY